MIKRLEEVLIQFVMALVIVAIFAIFDAIFGGAISTGLAGDKEWTRLDQFVNDVYSGLFSLIVIYSLIRLYRRNFPSYFIAAILILLITYFEDIVFYVTLNIIAPLIEFVSRDLIEVPRGFPDAIGGWVGWILRIFFDNAIFSGFPIKLVFYFNALGLIGAFIMLWLGTKEKNEDISLPDALRSANIRPKQ